MCMCGMDEMLLTFMLSKHRKANLGVTKQMPALCLKGGVLEHALACKIARAISQSNNVVTWYTEVTIVLESTF